MIATRVELTIDRLGQRGEGIARGPHGQVFVAHALPGELILAEVDGLVRGGLELGAKRRPAALAIERTRQEIALGNTLGEAL